MDNSIKPLIFLKKNKIALASILAFLVALGCVFAFAGNEASDVPDTASVVENIDISVPVAESEGYGLYIDGSFVAAVSDKNVADAAVADTLSSRVKALKLDVSAEHSFKNHVEIKQGTYSNDVFVEVSELSQLLRNSNRITDYSGNVLPVKLSVLSVSTKSETVTVEFETKTIYTDALRDGVESVVNKGFNGEELNTYQISAVDGVEIERKVVSTEVITPVVNQVLRVGTRCSGMTVASIGTLMKPYDGMITSYFGPRWGRNHNGLDITAGYGESCFRDPAVAAADGVVVRAGVYGGYGNCVVLDHGDGMQTLYAHFDSISVSVGDVVKAGQEVGKIGSTGNSTGPHLHFEVLIDGEFINPLIFVDYE